jgi:Tol biopolymer transport system component
MTTPLRFEHDLPRLLEDAYVAGTPDYRDDLVQRIAATRQRPAWTFPERWLPVDITTQAAPAARMPWRTLGILALIGVLVALAAIAVIGSQQRRLPAPFGPAANGQIPFEQDGDIYLGDPTTGSTRLLVGGPEVDGFAEASRDGARILFGREAPGGYHLFVVNDDGSGLRRITDEVLRDAQMGAWSADSRSYYQTHVVGGIQVLDAFDAIGDAEPRRIAEGVADRIAVRPPDGTEIAFRSRTLDGRWGLSVVNADGSNLRTLADHTVPAEMDQSFNNFAYSPDGARIYYQHGDETGCCRLWVMNADGTGKREFLDLGPAWDGQPALSPDGSRIAYWHNANDSGPHGIWVARTDGTGQAIETGPDLPGGADWVWAPDSSAILMFPLDVSRGSAYLLDPDGGPFETVPWTSGQTVDWQRLAD